MSAYERFNSLRSPSLQLGKRRRKPKKDLERAKRKYAEIVTRDADVDVYDDCDSFGMGIAAWLVHTYLGILITRTDDRIGSHSIVNERV
jgi:hypothetical protein